MDIYIDETYDMDDNRFIIGGLFCNEGNKINKEIIDMKIKNNYIKTDNSIKEIKYKKCDYENKLIIAKNMIDIFIKSDCYFRAIVIEKKAKGFNLNKFGNISKEKKLIKDKLYKKFLELLITHNTYEQIGINIFLDKFYRSKKDKMIEILIKDLKYCTEKICETDSNSILHQPIQITDILIGCILNGLNKCSNPKKKELSNYLRSRLGLELSKDYRINISKEFIKYFHHKLNIWYWKPY